MSRADEAFTKAEREIATALVAGQTHLSLRVNGLQALPAAIATMTNLQSLNLGGTQVTCLLYTSPSPRDS